MFGQMTDDLFALPARSIVGPVNPVDSPSSFHRRGSGPSEHLQLEFDPPRTASATAFSQ
jgi:hypothetical protein